MRSNKRSCRAKIKGLGRACITITEKDRKYLEKLGGDAGLVAGIREAVRKLKGMK